MVKGIDWKIPCLEIKDLPRFKWRGLMLDCSRTFIPKKQIEKYLEIMSFFKMNVLQMHLTDNQGWRLEIKKYPKLVSISSKFDSSFHEPEEYQGYYSQDDIRELVEFAMQRNIQIVPEIEMPGHTSEVFASYPQFSCNGDTSTVEPWKKGVGLNKSIFCAGNDGTFIFLENILDEVADLFPSQFIHIGGDEAPKDYWKVCPKCQKRIKDEVLKNEDELQSWFVKRIEKYINSKRKKLVGWDEIMEGGLNKSATVMYWRSWKKSVAQKIPFISNNMVMTPTSFCYFDYSYDKISSEKLYSYNPVPEEMPAKNVGHVLGVQANFWSHLARTEPEMDRQLFPRLLALSEIAWTGNDKKNWVDFNNRLQQKLESLTILGAYYFKEKY
jgi:hexosaminidase